MLFTTIVNFLHSLATVTWIGGMIYVNLVLGPSLEAIDPPQRGRLSGAVAKHFSPYAWGSIIILVITGFLKTPSGMLFNLSSPYGTILFAKHVLVLAMILIGLLITFYTAPKMEALAPKPGERPAPAFVNAQNQLALLAQVNMILGILVLLVIAVVV